MDIDDAGNDMSKHGVIAAERLNGELPEYCLHAIKAHDFRTGVIPKSKLDKALRAVDSITVVMERMKEPFQKIDAEALKKKIEDTSKYPPWHKRNILKCKEIGLRLDEFLNVCLNSLRNWV